MFRFYPVFRFVFYSASILDPVVGAFSIQEPDTIYPFIATGIVLDQTTGQPVEMANVYLSHTTLAAVTDRDGCFLLRGIPWVKQRFADDLPRDYRPDPTN